MTLKSVWNDVYLSVCLSVSLSLSVSLWGVAESFDPLGKNTARMRGGTIWNCIKDNRDWDYPPVSIENISILRHKSIPKFDSLQLYPPPSHFSSFLTIGMRRTAWRVEVVATAEGGVTHTRTIQGGEVPSKSSETNL
jgi:hypothetical protein